MQFWSSKVWGWGAPVWLEDGWHGVSGGFRGEPKRDRMGKISFIKLNQKLTTYTPKKATFPPC